MMRNCKEFEQEVTAVVLAACVNMLRIVFVLIVGGPIILAITISPWWLSLYAVYSAAFFIAAAMNTKSTHEADKYEEDMYEDH